jgi:hypothetical protein
MKTPREVIQRNAEDYVAGRIEKKDLFMFNKEVLPEELKIFLNHYIKLKRAAGYIPSFTDISILTGVAINRSDLIDDIISYYVRRVNHGYILRGEVTEAYKVYRIYCKIWDKETQEPNGINSIW